MKDGIYYAKDMEAAVLGVCMLEKDAFARIYGMVEEETFYFFDNQKVFSAINSLYAAGLPIDLLTVWEHMAGKSVKLNEGDVRWYLTTLTRDVVSAAHLEYHCHLLKKMWRKRELEKITQSGFDAMEDERSQAIDLQQRISDLLGTEQKRDWYSMDELMYELIMHQQAIANGEKEFVSTGFKAIDKLNGGFTPGQMIIIGARPSVGKSALANEIATNVARKGKKVGIVSLEMNNTEIAARLASIDTETDFGIIYRNLFTDERAHEAWYNRVSRQTINLPIYVSDKTKVDVAEIKSKAQKLRHRHGLDLLIIDYLQLIESSSTNRNYNREQEVAKISRGLKLMLMDMKIPGIVLCQLNRAVTGRKGKDRYPQLSDLRESGSLEQDADVVMMLHRDWMSGYEVVPPGEEGEGLSTEKMADLLGVKWRNGATFHLPLDFEPAQMRFKEKGGNLIPFHQPIEEGEAF